MATYIIISKYNNMYSDIFHPITNKPYSIYSETGQKILNRYVIQSGGKKNPRVQVKNVPRVKDLKK